ncbi:glycosyl hydrolases family 31-domain-containing protein [Gongronella butleri]|nr:glycosyl hydrolases family 31-domain-containing protein [Gongronella butleri]
MRQLVSDQFTFKQEQKHPLCFVNAQQHEVRIYVLGDTLFRVGYAVTPAECQALDDYEALQGINADTPAAFTVSQQQKEGIDTVIIDTKALHVQISLNPFAIAWFDANDKESEDDAWIAKDLAYRSYCHDPKFGTRWHYQQQPVDAFLYGLGERTGKLNLARRRFRLERTDAMGYDATKQDPLYKFSPFYLGLPRANNTARAYGIYYHQMGQTTLDLGSEKDAMWGNYSYYTNEGGPLMYSMIYGPSVPSVVRALHEYLGGYELMPKAMFGYLASAMGYAESEDAQERLTKFVSDCRDVYDIPCDGMHLSSGYTVDPAGDRCVFTWNKTRFPDPAGLAKLYKDNGMRLIANIKPWLLTTHPDYKEMEAQHGLVWQPPEDGVNGKPATLWQWRAGANTKGLASYIDFTSKAGYDYWRNKATSQLLELGYDMWVDNNEFTLMDEAQSFKNQINWTQYPRNMKADYELSIASRERAGIELGICNVPSPIQTALMIQSSYDAARAHQPNERVCLVTRSSVPFAQKLVAHTWSGDNYTSWDTVAYNIPMGTGACLSGMPAGYGHDISGFAGPKCPPEMLIRWVQQGITWTRCCIHSYKPEGSLTEPWMYPEALPVIRKALKWRYEFIPYLYSVYVTSAFRNKQPVVRPTFYDHQHDFNTFEQNFEFMLGQDVLVAPVYEPGVHTRTTYLPAVDNGWYHYQTGQFYEGGSDATVPSTLEDHVSPLFIKAGALLCFGKTMKHVNAEKDDERRVVVYPAAGKSKRTSLTIIEDDGTTLDHERDGKYTEIEVWMESDAETITIGVDIVHNEYKIAYDTIYLACPVPTEKRTIVIADQNKAAGTTTLSDDQKYIAIALP